MPSGKKNKNTQTRIKIHYSQRLNKGAMSLKHS